MIIFWLLSAIMIAMAVLMVIRPLAGVRPKVDQQQLLDVVAEAYDKKKNTDDFNHVVGNALKVQQSNPSLATLGFGLFLAALIPLLTLFGYNLVGAPNALLEQQFVNQVATSQQNAGAKKQGKDMQTSIQALLTRLSNNPDDEDGWLLLGRAYANTDQYPAAVASFERALKINDDPLTRIDLAEALLFSSQDRKFPARAIKLLKSAVQDQPEAQKGLWLLGLAYEQEGDLDHARDQWQNLVALLPEGSSVAVAVQEQINKLTKSEEAAGPSSQQQSNSARANQLEIKISVDISEELKQKLMPTDTLYVFVKAKSGPPMPLAAVKLPVGAFPMQAVISDADSLMPQRKLSSMDEVKISAKISHSGNAMPQAGDFESDSVIRSTADWSEVKLLINKIKK